MPATTTTTHNLVHITGGSSSFWPHMTATTKKSSISRLNTLTAYLSRWFASVPQQPREVEKSARFRSVRKSCLARNALQTTHRRCGGHFYNYCYPKVIIIVGINIYTYVCIYIYINIHLLLLVLVLWRDSC
jgi:hypothetical protein